MLHDFRSSGASSLALSVDDIHHTFSNSLASDEPPAILTTLLALLPCTPEAIASAPIELIDRERGLLRVADPKGEMAEVALGTHAALAVETAVMGRTSGPLVVDAHGAALDGCADTEAYAKELLTVAAGSPPAPGWSFRNLRETIFAEMADGGVPQHVVMAQAGLGHRCTKGIGRDAMIVVQRACADWWSYRIGLLPPSPFVTAHALAIESSRTLVAVTIERGVRR